MAAVLITEAARVLNTSVRQLRRDIAAGAPIARRGGRGRGRAALIDVPAMEAWRRSRSAAQPNDRLSAFAAEVPEIVAAAMYAAFIATEGPSKRNAAGVLAGAWYLATTALLDRIRQDVPQVPEVSTQPDKIGQLRHIFGSSETMPPR